jgi:hypothetical protein
VSPAVVSVVISGVGLVLSLAGSAFIAGLRWGTVKTRIDMLEQSQGQLATKDQLAGVKEDVAEIKGMFRMTLKDG